MLVLARKRDEAIRVGDVKITLVEIRGDKARIGIEAPADAPVHREEVYQKIHAGSPDIKAPVRLNKCWKCGQRNEFVNDSSGTPAQRGQPIICGGCGNRYIA